ncbi:MAG: Ku protein [Methylotenera sp.]|nr:MAG: Ku protein [Methylotenera sp.]
MPRALWKGAISFGLIHIPVDLYSAENSHQLDLDMLDKHDFSPIGYKRVNKVTGKEVEFKDIVKGYEFEDNQYVVLSEEDIKRANPEATQTINIMAFIEAAEISPVYYEQPYYLTPSKGGDKVYSLLRETLKKSKKIAIAQLVIRVKQHLAALIPINDMIVLIILRYADEIRTMKDYKLPDAKSSKNAVSAKEVQMAMSLVEGMTEKWNPENYKDTYRDDIMSLIEKRIKSKQTKVLDESKVEGPAPASNIVDIMALLKQSIEAKTGRDKTNTSKASGSKPTDIKSAVKSARSKSAGTKPVAKPAGKATAKPKPVTKSRKVA